MTIGYYLLTHLFQVYFKQQNLFDEVSEYLPQKAEEDMEDEEDNMSLGEPEFDD